MNFPDMVIPERKFRTENSGHGNSGTQKFRTTKIPDHKNSGPEHLGHKNSGTVNSANISIINFLTKNNEFLAKFPNQKLSPTA